MKKITLECNGIKIGVNSNGNDLVLDLVKKFGLYFNLTNYQIVIFSF